MNRRQSTPDTRADIVRCVEYREALLSPHRYGAHVGGHTVCDLIPHAREYRVCLELGALPASQKEVFPTPKTLSVVQTPQNIEVFPAPPTTLGIETTPKDLTPPPTVNFAPYDKHTDVSQPCAICVQSNPDISKMTSFPIKSCLKKTKTQDFASSVSLPSAELKEEKAKSDIEDVNREWNRAYDPPETDRVLNKISNDLDFLLNRTKENVVEKI